MHSMYEHGTKARLSFSGLPHTRVNMADSMEEVNVAMSTGLCDPPEKQSLTLT